MTLIEQNAVSAPGASGVVTVASLARDWARRTPSQVAMREKDFGIWHEYTWETTWSLIEDAAFALLDRTKGMTQSPERAARRLSVGALSRAMPGPMRNAFWLARGIASIGVRYR